MIQKEPCTFCAYIGPSIRGVVQNGTIYSGTKEEILEFLAPAIEKYPRIADLVISGDELPQSRIMIRTKGNYLYETRRKFIAELRKGA